ncbi:MAG: hypothetical protein AB7O37_20980 [Vicinamibacteria bacterium]
MPGANFSGIDVGGLDVEAFLGTSRALYPVVALALLGLAWRRRGPGLLLLGVVLGNAWAWFVTNWPLRSLYGLLSSSDRLGNLGLVQVVAAGNSPIRTSQVGQLHFEPFWGAFLALVTGFEPERVLALYPFLPLVMAVGFALTLYWALSGPGGSGLPAAERAVIAGFATLLSSAPLEFAGTYRTPWALMFLMKPNHALALVLAPLVLRQVAGIRGWRDRVLAGALLHLLAWAFVLHMAFFSVGLVAFAAWSFFDRRTEARKDAVDVCAVIGVNALIVSPYLVMLLLGYAFLQPSPHMTIAPYSAHLLEALIQHAPLTLLALIGIRTLARGPRLARLLAAQGVGAVVVWLCYFLLSFLQLARERDEAYYWLRIWLAACAASGAFELARLIAEAARLECCGPRRAAAVLALALPWSVPYWWQPALMDSYFAGSLAPVPDRLRLPTDFIRRETDRRAVFAGDEQYCRYVAALGGRRALLMPALGQTRDAGHRYEIETSLLALQPSLADARAMGVSHLVVTRQYLEAKGVSLDELRSRAHLREVFRWSSPSDFVSVFELRGAP